MTASIYPLNDGDKDLEIKRLNGQHYDVWMPCTKGLIPSTILSDLRARESQAPVAVADVGTGTGVWLQELARELSPTARLDGFDLDTTKFPDASQLPENVSLHFGDCLRPFPEEYHGKYDVVHARLLLLAFNERQWAEAVSTFAALVKPGGWLFWDEPCETTVNAFPATYLWADWSNFYARFSKMVGKNPCAVVNLLRDFRSAGFKDSDQEVYSTFAVEDEGYRKKAAYFLLNASDKMMHGLVEKGGIEGVRTHADASRIVDGIKKEVEEGVTHIGFEIYWVFGRKPM